MNIVIQMLRDRWRWIAGGMAAVAVIGVVYFFRSEVGPLIKILISSISICAISTAIKQSLDVAKTVMDLRKAPAEFEKLQLELERLRAERAERAIGHAPGEPEQKTRVMIEEVYTRKGKLRSRKWSALAWIAALVLGLGSWDAVSQAAVAIRRYVDGQKERHKARPAPQLPAAPQRKPITEAIPNELEAGQIHNQGGILMDHAGVWVLIDREVTWLTVPAQLEPTARKFEKQYVDINFRLTPGAQRVVTSIRAATDPIPLKAVTTANAAELLGGDQPKTVLFWDTPCSACYESIAQLREYADRNSRSELFIARLAKESTIGDQFGVTGVPSLIVVKGGQLMSIFRGGAEIEQYLQADH